jgi:hypothetical protein
VKRAARLGAAVALALGAAAAPAHAAGFTLGLATQTDAVVGRPLLIQATGTIPPEDIQFPYWFSLDAIPPTVTTTCPPDHFEGAQFANANGGAVITFDQGERPDSAGSFTVPVAVTPRAPGSVLLCAYTDDGATNTLATASLMLDIKPAAPSGSRLHRAMARCRRRPSRRARAHCLRAVRRAAG